jgi:serine/threonine protein phosphatase 1
MMKQKLTYYPKSIPLPEKGRRIAIGDVHGCYYSLKALLEEQVQLTDEDQLFLLGDYINRGDHSALALDYVMELVAAGNTYALRGNHEQKLLMAFDCGFDFFEEFLEEYGSSDLLDERMYRYLEFCAGLDYCIQSGDFLLSHCGFTQGVPTPFTDLREMFHGVDIVLDETLLKTCHSIHGHSTEAIATIEKKVAERHKAICLDAGCAYEDNEDLGQLCALDLDSFQLYKQANVDLLYRKESY